MDTDKIMPLKATELGKSVTYIPPKHRMVNIVQHAIAAAEAREEQRNAEIKELEEENARLESEMTNVECPFCHQTFEVSI